MRQFMVHWVMEGTTSVEADSEEEARRTFDGITSLEDDLSDVRIVDVDDEGEIETDED